MTENQKRRYRKARKWVHVFEPKNKWLKDSDWWFLLTLSGLFIGYYIILQLLRSYNG